MSNQIVISSGAKVRSLEGVLTGTAGIVNSVPLGGANGVATLDALGKVPLSQLPASVVTYLGTWNAATNTPTLTNGVGDVGDLYICNVAGTVNFGAGPITFAVGDWVIYSGTEWQKSSGASGTVTSVAVTESGDALTITGSPITTSGTINIGFAGTGSQYIKGDGTLATFPTTIDQAKRLITEVYNSTGATLTKGTVVYINGGQGNLPTVTKAIATGDATSAQTYGVVQSDITDNNNGYVVVLGSLTDLDTSAYANGTQLYLSGTTAGDWTSTKPSAPIHLVYVGIVVRSHPTQGVVEIRIQNGYELEELHDVAISSPVNNQGIFYNSSTDLWENKSIATALGYTPANDALVVHLAGTETITGVKNFDIGLTLRDGFQPTPATGYIGLASNGSGLTILTKPSATVYNHNLQFQASSNDYNFPAITGVMAMLEGTQTFTGDKTFSGDILATNYYRVQQNATLGVAPSGYSTFGAINTKLNFGVGVAVSTQKVFQFETSGLTNNTTRVYTLPDASGTLALTSNLSSYVPYTGATTNVDLGSNFLKARTFYSEGSGGGGSYAIKNGTTPAFEDGYTILSSNDYRLNIVSTVSAATKAVYFGFSGVTATRTYTLPDATGTIALTSDIPSLSGYVQGSGTTNYHAKFTGASTIGNSMLTDDGTTLQSIGATRSNLYLRAASSSFYGQLAFTNGSNGSFGGISYNNSGQYMQFETNSSEWMRLYGNGNLRVFSSSATDNGAKFQVEGNTRLSGTLRVNGTDAPVSALDVQVDTDKKVILGGGYPTVSAGTYWGGMLYNGTQFRIESFLGSTPQNIVIASSGGNVGIGTSSPAASLDIYLSSVGTYFRGGSDNVARQLRIFSSTTTNPGDTHTFDAQSGTGNLVFQTTSTERMRITSDGKALFGTSTAGFGLFSTQRITINPISDGVVVGPLPQNNSAYTTQASDNSGNRFALYIANGSSSNVGSISFTSSSTAFNTSSDYRLKEDFKETKGLEKVEAIKVYDFKWKISDERMDGVLAHELAEVLPYAVLGEKDGEQMQSVDYSKLVPVLVKAIQEQQEIINQLSAKVTALENK